MAGRRQRPTACRRDGESRWGSPVCQPSSPWGILSQCCIHRDKCCSSQLTKFYQFYRTLGNPSEMDAPHINVIRSTFTRNIPNVFDDMNDEMLQAFDDLIPCEGSGVYSIGISITLLTNWFRLVQTIRTWYFGSADFQNHIPRISWVTIEYGLILFWNAAYLYNSPFTGKDAEYRELALQSAMELVKGRLLFFFPTVLRSYALPY